MLTRSDFPEDFVFGAATAAYQIEGHAFGGAGRCIWDDFAATPGNVIRNENGAVACDHYNRWPADLDLLRDANLDAYRFSTSWARVMPEGRGAVNAEGLDFYDKLVDGMLERGIKPMVTLYHWELPSALQDLGGWTNKDIAKWFSDYAEVVMGRIGDRVWKTATINELFCVSVLGYLDGRHAPGTHNVRAGVRAMHNVALAHGTAVEALRAAGHGELGAVCNFTHHRPVDDSPETAAAMVRAEDLNNRFFISGFFKGEYPENFVENVGEHLPEGWQKDLETISAPVDWLGVNYYFSTIVGAEKGPWPAIRDIEGPLPKTQMGWEIYPDGLRHFLRMCSDEYSGDTPLYITENGMANPDVVVDGEVRDTVRTEYLTQHFAKARQAIDEGVPLKGYFVWSLMDNYEWAFGYEKRFGIVHVDFDSLERTPKGTYYALQTALAR